MAWAVLFTLAWALTVAVEAGLTPGEAGIVREVQAWSVPGETLSDAVRAVTSTPFVIAAGAAIAAAHWVARDRRGAIVLAVLLFLLPAAQTGIKEVVDRPRPSEAAEGIQVRASQTSPSFPAGHVMGPVVVYGWAVVVVARGRVGTEVRDDGTRFRGLKPAAMRRWLRLLGEAVLIAMIVLTGPVNVWLGVHWPTDVAGGYLWGALLLSPGVVVREWRPQNSGG